MTDGPDSLPRLAASFFGVNLLLAGVFIVLLPHLVIRRVLRSARRLRRRHATLAR